MAEIAVAAAIGAGVGAGVAAISGGDIGKGALFGAGIGAGAGAGGFDPFSVGSGGSVGPGAFLGSEGVGAETLFTSGGGGGFFSGAGDFFSSLSFSDALTGVSALDSLVSPILTGGRIEEIGEINALQTELDVEQKLLQGREQSVRALQNLNQQTAFNITRGFSSGLGLSPNVGAAIDSLERQTNFNETLSRTTNILQAGALQRQADLQRKTGAFQGTRESFKALEGAQQLNTLFQSV